MPRRAPLCSLLRLAPRAFVLAVAALVATRPASARQATGPERDVHSVFILHSYSARNSYTVAQDTAIRETIARATKSPVAFFTFELDTTRQEIPDASWALVSEFLKERYTGRPIDVIVTTDTLASRFMERYADHLFPGVPIVCSAPTEAPALPPELAARVTGVVESLPIAKTLEFIQYLQPRATNLLLINTEGPYGDRLKAETLAAVATLTNPLTLRWIPPASVEETATVLRDAADTDAVLYLNYWDPTGEYTTIDQTLGLFTAECPRPIFAVYDIYLGSGVIGGFMASAESYGKIAGTIASRILQGEKPANFPFVHGANPLMLDARQLDRFGVPRSAVPHGSIIRYEQPTFLQEHGRLLAVAAAIVLAQGAAIGVLVSSLRRLRRAEAALLVSERRFRDLAENIPGIVYRQINSPRGERRLDFASRGMERLLGEETASLLREDFNRYFSLMSRDDFDLIQRIADAALRDGTPFNATYSIPAEHGERRAIRSTATHRRLPDGSIEWNGVLLDVTSEQSVRDALIESEERNRSIVEALPVGVCVHDGERFQYINEALRTMLAADSDVPIIDHPVSRVFHPDDWPICLERGMAVLGEGVPAGPRELRLVALDGRVIDVEIRCTPIMFKGRRVSHTTVVDLTRRKAAEESLRRTTQLQQLLLSELDHRVKNSLAALASLIDITRAGATGLNEFAASIRARVLAMASVHSILSDAHWLPVPLERLVRSLVPPALPGTVITDGPPVEIPARQVTALAMIVHELFTNSIKYGAASAPGGIVSVSWITDGALDDSAATDLTLRWTETGGPLIAKPVKHGAGLRLIEGFCKFELGGAATFHFGPGGADHRFKCRLDSETPAHHRALEHNGPSVVLSEAGTRV